MICERNKRRGQVWLITLILLCRICCQIFKCPTDTLGVKNYRFVHRLGAHERFPHVRFRAGKFETRSLKPTGRVRWMHTLLSVVSKKNILVWKFGQYLSYSVRAATHAGWICSFSTSNRDWNRFSSIFYALTFLNTIFMLFLNLRRNFEGNSKTQSTPCLRCFSMQRSNFWHEKRHGNNFFLCFQNQCA